MLVQTVGHVKVVIKRAQGVTSRLTQGAPEMQIMGPSEICILKGTQAILPQGMPTFAKVWELFPEATTLNYQKPN